MDTHGSPVDAETGQLLGLLRQLGGQRVLVAGDVYLDHWVFGRPSRISREAPIMVLDEERREDRLGGGAAPALALRVLGCEVIFAGVVGDDAEGERVRELLAGAGIDTSAVITDPTRPTTVKTRLVAEGFLIYAQQIVRLDRQSRTPIPAVAEAALISAFNASPCQALLISDYRSGVVTEEVVAAARAVRERRGGLLTVDSQGDLAKFREFDLVKCNQSEAEAVLGAPLGDRPSRAASLSHLREKLACGGLVVTRGGEGASLATPDAYAEIPAANRSEVFDVTGAGDTVVAVMTAALLAGANPLEAAQLAQAAAGVVVRKWGNAQATIPEIAAELRR
jgi:D-glycero-beta-D-manno-heptose-7-phosphate kinase